MKTSREEILVKGLASIVVGLDFSECSRVALGHAQRIASWSGAQLHPVHVVDAPVGEIREDAALTAMQRGIREGLVADARKQWDAFVGGTPGASDLHLDVCVAHRLVGIRRQLDHYKADLLVLGAFGEERPHVGMGTLASSCVRAVSTDVLIVRDNYRDAFRTVVVGVDFSETSRRALEAGAMLAAREASILRVVFVEPHARGSDPLQSRDIRQELEMFAREATAAWPELRVRYDVYPHTGHRSGLLEFATVVHGDIVVVGTRGRTNLRDAVLGSTAEKVLRDSVIAVWACKPAEDAPGPA